MQTIDYLKHEKINKAVALLLSHFKVHEDRATQFKKLLPEYSNYDSESLAKKIVDQIEETYSTNNRSFDPETIVLLFEDLIENTLSLHSEFMQDNIRDKEYKLLLQKLVEDSKTQKSIPAFNITYCSMFNHSQYAQEPVKPAPDKFLRKNQPPRP